MVTWSLTSFKHSLEVESINKIERQVNFGLLSFGKKCLFCRADTEGAYLYYHCSIKISDQILWLTALDDVCDIRKMTSVVQGYRQKKEPQPRSPGTRLRCFSWPVKNGGKFLHILQIEIFELLSKTDSNCKNSNNRTRRISG